MVVNVVSDDCCLRVAFGFRRPPNNDFLGTTRLVVVLWFLSIVVTFSVEVVLRVTAGVVMLVVEGAIIISVLCCVVFCLYYVWCVSRKGFGCKLWVTVTTTIWKFLRIPL